VISLPEKLLSLSHMKMHHRDTEKDEVAQRKKKTPFLFENKKGGSCVKRTKKQKIFSFWAHCGDFFILLSSKKRNLFPFSVQPHLSLCLCGESVCVKKSMKSG